MLLFEERTSLSNSLPRHQKKSIYFFLKISPPQYLNHFWTFFRVFRKSFFGKSIF